MALSLTCPLYGQAEIPKFPAINFSQASSEIKKAVVLNSQIEENHLRTDLSGVTTGSLEVSVQIHTLSDFHIYEDRIQFWTENDEALGSEWITEIKVKPVAHQFLDPVSKKIKSGYHGQDVFEITLKIPHNIPKPLALDHKIPLVVAFQTCNKNICLLPVAIRMELAFPNAGLVQKDLAGPSIFEKFLNPEKLLSGPNPLKSFSIFTLLILFLSGLITAFTPCVYPLYPITLGIFTKWSSKSHVSPFFLALAYCMGLTLSYASLGLVSGVSGFVFGSITQKPAFLISVGILIIISAVFFEGLLNFKMPQKLENFFSSPVKDTSKSQWHHLCKAALMGAGLGIVASPCVGPVLVAILAWLGTTLSETGTHAFIKGFIYLGTFGLGMSAPFLVLGHFIIRLHKHPSLGRFTPYAKHLGTLFMLIAGMFFIVPGVKLLRSQNSRQMPTYSYETLDSWNKSNWSILDFRADWCGACIELEVETLGSPEIKKLIDSHGWSYVRIDLSNMSPENQKIAAEFKVLGLPTVQIYGPQGKHCANFDLFGFESSSKFLARLAGAKVECR